MKKYSDETKAAALAALVEGQSVNAIAREYKIPPGTISSWKNRDLQGIEIQKNSKVGDLLIEYLNANLHALIKQTYVFSDETWLKKQNAADAAVLHGVMTDKTIRLVEALSKASSKDATENTNS